jgi:iron complex outermembrane receptor protein
MVALEKDLFGTVLHARYAESSSRPTVWELLGTKGTFNLELEPEHWREVEFGLRNDGAVTSAGFAAYYRSVDDLIAEKQDSTGSVFVNDGSARIAGMELTAGAQGELEGGWRLRLFFSFALQDGVHSSSSSDGELGIPGLEYGSLAAVLRLQYRGSPYMEIYGRTYASVLANDRTDERTPDAGVTNLRIGHAVFFGKSRVEVFAQCENLFDRRYSAFVQVNDPGRRYYNPAPGRSFFAGASLRFKTH